VAASALERGRQAYARRAWKNSYELLHRADDAAPLEAGDLELLATTAFMLGRDDEYLSLLERAHHVHLEAGETLPAVRNPVWMGLVLVPRGEMGPAELGKVSGSRHGIAVGGRRPRTGPTTSGITSPALRTTMVSPTRTSLRATSSSL